jgi:hypothetical protein
MQRLQMGEPTQAAASPQAVLHWALEVQQKLLQAVRDGSASNWSIQTTPGSSVAAGVAEASTGACRMSVISGTAVEAAPETGSSAAHTGIESPPTRSIITIMIHVKRLDILGSPFHIPGCQEFGTLLDEPRESAAPEEQRIVRFS